MLFWITMIFICQLIGEVAVALTHLPVPGPVAGMVILFVLLAFKGAVPDGLGQVSGQLLKHLSLLFVPAGTGIIVHLPLIANDIVPVSVTLIVSTLATIAVTGLLMQLLTRKSSGKA